MTNIVGDSNSKDVAAITGNNTAGGRGVEGFSDTGQAVFGESRDWQGVCGKSTNQAGVVGISEGFDGVWGESHGKGVSGVSGRNTHAEGGFGVWGNSDAGTGVGGFSKTWVGVYGHSEKQTGVSGVSEGFDGVWGESHGQGFSGVSGRNTHAQGGFGVWGSSDAGTGVGGFSKTWAGVYGHSEKQTGVSGVSEAFVGVWAETKTADHPGIFAKGPRLAARFDGNVEVTGDVVLTNADCAEDFDIANAGSVEPGTVMVLGEEGTLHQSQQAYDKRVAGVISGAGNCRPAIVLDKQPTRGRRLPIALLGKVFCKVDAETAPVEAGDLLTTSDTPGHAMKASNSAKAFGSVIGKALRPLSEGRGLIPVLIALQ